MAEIAKCVCGKKPWLFDEPNRWRFVKCACGWSGPFHHDPSEAIAAWNRVIRPRPVVTERLNPIGTREFEIGEEFSLGCYDLNCEDAECYFTNESYTDDNPRSWLISKLTAAGFDVVEREEGK